MSAIEKQSAIQQLVLSVYDDSILSMVQELLAKNAIQKQDTWNTLSAEEKSAIEEGIAELDAGKGVKHQSVVSQFRKEFSYGR